MTTIAKVDAAVGPQFIMNEDLIRKSLIDAIELIQKHKHDQTLGGWFKFSNTAQKYLQNLQDHHNMELEALLRGTYLQFMEWQVKEGKRRNEKGTFCV